MKRLFIWGMLIASLAASAQKDVELQEIAVKASRVVQRVDGQTIYPTRQQLEGSTNGYSLLSKLALPHLRVDPAMHTVTALSNLGNVQVRINDIIASKEDLLSLDMKAVKHIDYIDNPGVRYGEGIAYVVNIIVKHPISGYDVGADLTNTLTAVNGDETIYGKFNYGKSEFGVTYSLDYHNFKGTEYEENDTDASSTKPEDLKKCLHAGVIPDAYKGVIEGMEVKEVRRKVKEDNDQAPKSIYGTSEEMLAKAKEGYFVRDPEANLVYCPTGEILRQKCVKKNGNIRYANKNACRHCPNRNKCYKGKNEWKEIDFNKDTLEKPCRDWLKAEGKEPAKTTKIPKGRFEKIKIVVLKLKPDREKMSQRLCLSEHPFGTIKHSMGADYFLLNGLEKVAGEFALSAIAYNMKRSRNLLGFNKMMKLMMI